MKAEKRLEIYKENEDYVIERINEFNHASKKRYSKAGLIEALENYKVHGNLEEYDIQISDELWSLVVNTLAKEV